MREGSHGFGFALEARQCLRILRQALGQDFDGDISLSRRPGGNWPNSSCGSNACFAAMDFWTTRNFLQLRLSAGPPLLQRSRDLWVGTVGSQEERPFRASPGSRRRAGGNCLVSAAFRSWLLAPIGASPQLKLFAAGQLRGGSARRTVAENTMKLFATISSWSPAATTRARSALRERPALATSSAGSYRNWHSPPRHFQFYRTAIFTSGPVIHPQVSRTEARPAAVPSGTLKLT